MSLSVSPRATWSRPIFIGSLVFMTGLGLFGLGVMLSNTYGASQVAAHARSLHWSNATLGGAGIARAAVAQAVFFSFGEVSDEEGKAIAIDEARSNLDSVAGMLTGGDGEADTPLEAAILDFVSAGERAVGLAEQGAVGDAERARLGEVEPAFETLSGLLNERLLVTAAAIAQSEQTGGRIARFTFVAISFMIPAIAMVVFWLVFRRRMRVRESEMQAHLDAERQLNRAKDEFIAGLSHELRTPLTTIYGFSEILSADEGLDGGTREMLSLINSSSADLTRMVNDLLTAARLDADALSVNQRMANLADEVATATAPYTRAGERIDIRVPSIDVYTDPLHLRQIVGNLVSNALRHGGDRVVITSKVQQGKPTLVVADNGDGVPPDVEKRLFTRFTHEGRQALVAGSVGLGLAISRELAMRQGGSLQYRRVGDWTTFSLALRPLPRIDNAEHDDLVGAGETLP